MATLSDSLKNLAHCGYQLSGSNITTNILLYADDACLVADGPAGAQCLLSQVGKWLDWTEMRAKVQKCCTLGLQASSAKIYNPELQLQDQIIPYAGKKSIPFLGGTAC